MARTSQPVARLQPSPEEKGIKTHLDVVARLSKRCSRALKKKGLRPLPMMAPTSGAAAAEP